jgi:peptidoglycan/LPS O-acetylase OafA/YrhL
MQPYWMVVMVGPLAVCLLLAGVLRGPGARSISRNRIFATVGGMCYSIYLMHYPTMVLIAPIFARRTGWVVTSALAAVDLVVVLAVCLTFYLLVERPCMDPTWPARLTRAVRAPLRRMPSDPGPLPTRVGVDA